MKWFNFKNLFAKKAKKGKNDYESLSSKSFGKSKGFSKSALQFVTSTGRYLLLVFISILLLAVGFIALPQTEKLLPNAVFDLAPKKYWSKIYSLEVELKKNESNLFSQQMEITKSVIARRLSRIGAENIQVYESDNPKAKADTDTLTYKYIDIRVTASGEATIIDEIVRSRYFITFYTPKDNVDFTDEENPIAQYLPENYNEVDITSWDFRHFLIQELPTTTGDTAYFAVYKPEFFNNKFMNFATANAGKKIGIGIDGFITQTTMPSDFASSTATAKDKIFALSVGTDSQRATIADIMYNSGVVPLKYTVLSSNDEVYSIPKSNYVYLLAIVVIALAFYALFMRIFERDTIRTVLTRVLSTLTVIAMWLALYKLLGLPADFTVMLGQAIMFIIVSEAILNTKEVQFRTIVVALIFYIFSWTSFGYLTLAMRELSALTLALYLVNGVLSYYIVNMKKYLLNE